MKVLANAYGARLTGRETEVWNYVRDGYSSREIALQLSITENTVANHRKNILRKKGLKRLSNFFRDSVN
jgi:DNA-binding CsgD family transcriptional regulator